MIFPLVLFVVLEIVGTYGHGRLMDPPARNSMWRLGYENPINYNDNELFCGGYTVYQQTNGGKCGVCGDDYRKPVPRDHEDGGKYGNGIIVRRYKVGQQISITVELTANHKGHMEVKICPYKPITQECFDSHPLNRVGQNTNKYSLSNGNTYSGTFTWDVQLPESMACSQCVIQWAYIAGNNWGRCEDGTERLGCGPQETFINCADVAIHSDTSEINECNYIKSDSKAVYHSGGEFSNVKKDETAPEDKVKFPAFNSQVCMPVGEFKNDQRMIEWCRTTCMKYSSECPTDKCKCVHNCYAIGDFAKHPGADLHCLQNCLHNPPYCPEEICKCI